MTVETLAVAARRSVRTHSLRRMLSSGNVIFIGAVLAALVVGRLSVGHPATAAAFVGAIGIVLLVASSIAALPAVLVLTMYAEGLSLGGIQIGRLVGLLAFAALLYYLLAGGRADLRPNLLIAAACAYGFWILVSVYWASDDGFVYSTFFKWGLSFAFMLAFAVLVREERHLRMLLAAFVSAAAAFGVVAVIEYLSSSGDARAVGLVGDPNQFATYQALALPAALVLARLERRPHLRLGYYVAVAFIVVSVGASFSRGGLIALVVVALASLLVPWRAFFRRPGDKVVYAVALGFAGWLVAALGSTAYLERIQSIFHGGDRGAGRTDLWAAAWNGYTHHPGLGLGAGGFQAHSLELLQSTPGVNTAASYVQAGRPVHNAYLETLTDLGPAGLSIYSLITALTAVYIIRAVRRFRASEDVTLQGIALALLVALAGLTVSSVFLSNELGRAVWMFVGLALALDRMSSKQFGRVVESRARAAGSHPRAGRALGTAGPGQGIA
jgi:O-antigen ligase